VLSRINYCMVIGMNPICPMQSFATPIFYWTWYFNLAPRSNEWKFFRSIAIYSTMTPMGAHYFVSDWDNPNEFKLTHVVFIFFFLENRITILSQVLILHI
jgi:hypothetical protein